MIQAQVPAWRETLKETAVVLGFLLLVAAAVYGPHIAHGGFYGDDWNNYAIYTIHAGNDFFEAVGAFQSFTNFRPVLPVYVPLTIAAFGRNSHLFLAWGTVLACLMSAAFYLLLRTLGMQRLHAAILAALLLVFPAADSTRLWATSSHLTLAIICFLLGATIALRALEHSGRRAVFMHGLAIALYLLAIWNHEMLVPAILATVLLYRLRVPWRRALRPYAADVLAVLLTLGFITSTGPNQAQQPLADTAVHAFDIAYQGFVVLSASLLPWLTPSRVMIAVPVVILAAAAVSMRRLPAGAAERPEVRRWLLLACAGIVAMGIGWSSFAPAADTMLYEPLAQGAAKRTNALAALGVVLAVYSLAQLLALGLARLIRPLNGKAPAIGLVIVALVGAGWIYRVEKDASAWNRAADIQEEVLDGIVEAVPNSPSGSSLFVGGYPTYSAPAVPAFAHYYDLDAALRARYDDDTIEAYPIVAPPPRNRFPKAIHPERDRQRREEYARLNSTQFICGEKEFEAIRTYRYRGLTKTRYGKGLFVNLSNGAVLRPLNREQCIAAVRATPAGPYQASNLPTWPRIGSWPPLL